MSWNNQSPWRVGPIPARAMTNHEGKKSWMGNIEAPIMLDDAVIKFWPNPDTGEPCFIIEGRMEFKKGS